MYALLGLFVMLGAENAEYGDVATPFTFRNHIFTKCTYTTKQNLQINPSPSLCGQLINFPYYKTTVYSQL